MEWVHCMRRKYQADWQAQDLQEGLKGSPYSIPHAVESADIGELLQSIQEVTTDAFAARNSLRQDIRQELLRKNRRVRELHESNRIEGLGPESLAGTKQILESRSAQDIEKAMRRPAVIRSLDVDRRTFDVIGLHGAKLAADELMAAHPDIPILEVDIRGMHQLVMGNDPSAGRYKQWLSKISGADHVPLPPSDTPAATARLVHWLNETVERGSLPAVVTAAAVHAWLAHIHPFDDGNGRIARLLTNIVIGAAGLPSLVVQDALDRARYIDALVTCDVAGDLGPLIGVFVRIQKRAIADMHDPEFALQLFEDEIAGRFVDRYHQWRNGFVLWLDELAAALLLYGLRLDYDDSAITQEMFRVSIHGLAS
jgi:Fic family protein